MSDSFETESSEAVVWMMSITDKEYKIDDRNEFQYSIETGISDIVSGKELFSDLFDGWGVKTDGWNKVD